MKRFLLTVLSIFALSAPMVAHADMVTGGTFAQFPVGLNTLISPKVTLAPTCSFRLWNEVKGIQFAVEGSAYATDVDLNDSTWGWGGAAYFKVRTIPFGSDNLLHVLAKGGVSSVGSLSLDPAQYQVGPVFDLDLDGGKNGTAFELGVYWMSADAGKIEQIGTQAQFVFDFE